MTYAECIAETIERGWDIQIYRSGTQVVVDVSFGSLEYPKLLHREYIPGHKFKDDPRLVEVALSKCVCTLVEYVESFAGAGI